MPLRVLIGCEESGVVRRAFRKRGHEAYSCDLAPPRDGDIVHHFQGDIVKLLCEDMDWDIIILHPDCTEMAVCSNRWYARGTEGWPERQKALEWTKSLWKLTKSIARIGCAIENPASTLWSVIGTPQYLQPWQHGHKETKKTGILTYGLPPLLPTRVVGPPPPSGTEERKSWERIWRMAPGDNRKRDRSETYFGVGEAMAEQWGNLNARH